jgi:hypothetical protein
LYQTLASVAGAPQSAFRAVSIASVVACPVSRVARNGIEETVTAPAILSLGGGTAFAGDAPPMIRAAATAVTSTTRIDRMWVPGVCRLAMPGRPIGSV